MRLSLVAIWAGLLGETVAAGCSSNNCLRAVRKEPSKSQNGTADCISFFQVTVTPATTTIFSTIVSHTSTTRNVTYTRNVTSTVTSTVTAEPSKRWVAQHEVVDVLMGALPLEGRQVTASPTSIPTYASACSSLAAYSSACSCIGITRSTITAPPPRTTHYLTTTSWSISNRTSTIYHNTTITNATTTVPFRNSTHPASISASATGVVGSATTSASSGSSSGSSSSSSSSLASSGTSLSDISSNILVASNTSSSSTPSPTSSRPSASLNSTTSGIFSNKTSSTSTLYHNATTSRPHFNATSTGYFPNATSLNSHFVNLTGPSTMLNASTTARFVNTTSAFLPANTTTARFVNTTTALPVSVNATTTGRYLNTTSTARYTNATATASSNATCGLPPGLLANSTGRYPFLNRTGARYPFPNATAGACPALNTSTPTPTLDTTCGETASPFKVRVGQAGGLFDGWYLNVVGNSILFSPSANVSSLFSVEATGHLCAVGYQGEKGYPLIAIVGNLDTGGDVWLLDGKVLQDVIKKRGYGPLKCSLSSGLTCSEGDMANWVGCGLQLDLTSQSGGTVVLDKFNCTALTLEAVYS